ncbi:MAG: SRPBCC family protein [Inquilinaceae bacterium]
MSQANTATKANNTGTLRREIFIEAAQATVFSFFTDPDKMARWMGTSHQLDPKPGGIYLVEVNATHTARGTFTEVTPNSRLVYTFGWDGADAAVPAGSSLVELDLEPKDHGTLVRMTHSGLPEPAVAPHTEGWTHYMGRLAIAAAGKDPGPDPWLKEKT